MFPIRDHNPSHKFPIVTVLFIALNVIFFFVELTATNLDTFLYSYALVPSQVNFTHPVSLLPFLTSMFLHGGWLHILSNMWFLWIFGDNIEAAFGRLRYALFYLVCGFAAALAQYLLDPNSTIPVLGASGAIAGVLGGYLVIYPRAQIETLITTFGGFMSRVNVPASLMLVYWFVTQLFAGVGSLGGAAEGGVAFFAHIGGFVAGWILATLLKPTLTFYRIE